MKWTQLSIIFGNHLNSTSKLTENVSKYHYVIIMNISYRDMQLINPSTMNKYSIIMHAYKFLGKHDKGFRNEVFCQLYCYISYFKRILQRTILWIRTYLYTFINYYIHYIPAQWNSLKILRTIQIRSNIMTCFTFQLMRKMPLFPTLN